ncbi:MAG TPA: hypothetical protein PK544_01105, partial [Spirochaetota bacterium]|nr:hypothetical protein [Spirochaetota bacterium]
MQYYKNNNLFTRLVLSFVSIPVICVPCYAGALRGGDTAPVMGNLPRTLRIQILSKQVRLLRQGLLQSVMFRFPAGTTMRRKGGSGPPCEVRGLSITMSGGRIRAASENGAPCSEGLWEITGGADPVCTVSVSGETRTYPLPLTMGIGRQGASFVVTEDFERYVRDSARAEYGHVPDERHEALRALRVLIAGRALRAVRSPRHEGAEFCDLTHCQVYRGRISDTSAGVDALRWVPDISGNTIPLLFHSRCGGKTFDGRVFGNDPAGLTAVEDWCAPLGVYVCRDRESPWRRSIRARELASIIKSGQTGTVSSLQHLRFDCNAMKVTVVIDGSEHIFAPEDFRLKINRIKGWNFIRSNNYRVTPCDNQGEQAFCFSGQGMGHGAGFCQHGALALAEAGYSWYEILKHYYPALSCVPVNNSAENPPELSWAVFSLRTGDVRHISHSQFLEHTVPPGSVFKLLVSLYCMTYRPDIIREYRFQCAGRHRDDRSIPECWLRRGHGNLGFTGALACSCNEYFGSLYRRIDRGHFQRWANGFMEKLGIEGRCGNVSGNRKFARLLGGLDFSMRFRGADFITLLRLVSDVPLEDQQIMTVRNSISAEMRNILRRSLIRVVREGTASPRPGDDEKKILYNQEKYDNNDSADVIEAVFGKTATVMDGTNRACSYGIFIGGTGDTGVMVLLRNGNGHRAARYGVRLLREYSGSE